MREFFPEDLEKIEVVKGPFSSLYGWYAMGGVVNFITQMPKKREIVLKAGYGSGFDRGDAMDDLKKVYLSYGDNIKNRLSFFCELWKTRNRWLSNKICIAIQNILNSIRGRYNSR